MESKDYLRNLLMNTPNAPRIYGKTNKVTDNGRKLSVYVVTDGQINDITSLVARCTTYTLTPSGLYVNGTGHCHIQAVAEELTALYGFTVQYEQLVSNYA